MTCFKFNLKVKDDAPLGERGKIFIPQNSSYYDMALEDPNDPTTYYNATQLKCTFNEVIVTVKSDTTPELVKVEGTDIVIDETRGMIYGFPEVFLDSENINDYVQATNDASVKFEPCEAGSGTGSLIKLMDGETVLETYEVVFLGDVNGDAVADEADFVLIDLFNSFYYIPDSFPDRSMRFPCRSRMCSLHLQVQNVYLPLWMQNQNFRIAQMLFPWKE